MIKIATPSSIIKWFFPLLAQRVPQLRPSQCAGPADDETLPQRAPAVRFGLARAGRYPMPLRIAPVCSIGLLIVLAGCAAPGQSISSTSASTLSGGPTVVAVRGGAVRPAEALARAVREGQNDREWGRLLRLFMAAS